MLGRSPSPSALKTSNRPRDAGSIRACQRFLHYGPGTAQLSGCLPEHGNPAGPAHHVRIQNGKKPCASPNCNRWREGSRFSAQSQPHVASQVSGGQRNPSSVVRATAQRRSRRWVGHHRYASAGRSGQGVLYEVAATTRRGGTDDAGLPTAGSKRLGNRVLDSLRLGVRREFGRPSTGPWS